jgi:hypothetical protein
MNPLVKAGLELILGNFACQNRLAQNHASGIEENDKINPDHTLQETNILVIYKIIYKRIFLYFKYFRYLYSHVNTFT